MKLENIIVTIWIAVSVLFGIYYVRHTQLKDENVEWPSGEQMGVARFGIATIVVVMSPIWVPPVLVGKAILI